MDTSYHLGGFIILKFVLGYPKKDLYTHLGRFLYFVN